MNKINLFNGNGHRYKLDMPCIHILADNINDVALDHIKKQTGLIFKKNGWGYEAKPRTFYQITKLFLTYDFKTQYHNNLTTKNTILLKFCNQDGFKVNSICFECCKDNNINLRGMTENDKLKV